MTRYTTEPKRLTLLRIGNALVAVSFTDVEKQELIGFVTRDRRTRRLSCEEITAEMSHACSAKTFREWCGPSDTTSAYPGESSTRDQTIDPVECSGPSWTDEEWKWVLIHQSTSFSTAGSGQSPPGYPITRRRVSSSSSYGRNSQPG